LFVLNLKAYPRVGGDAAIAFARTLFERSEQQGVSCAIAPPLAEIGRVAREVAIPVLAQHVDSFEPGPRTGFLVPESLAEAGGRGSLVNHSEHPLSARKVEETVDRLRATGLVSVVCAGTVREAARLAGPRPPYLAVEPPELIGGKISVAEARPEIISGTVEAVLARSPESVVLCGAGVHDRRDVKKAIELGSAGILVASAVATAKEPGRAIDELLRGF
jgi:triosephosphate isomerase (TIM)